MARPGFGMLVLALVACGHGRPADSAFSAASGVAPAPADSRFRLVPLRPIPGDVEILAGDPEKAGEFFVMRIKELPGTRIPVHSHPVDEHITVVQGSWYFAAGERWDRAALHELRAGDYGFAPKGTSMFGWCPDGAVVQVQGIGPFTIHWRHGVKSLDDAGAAEVFTFKRGDRVVGTRGPGVVRQGYASGDIVQYEVEAEGGARSMEDQVDLKPPR